MKATSSDYYWALCYECNEKTSAQEAKVVREVFIYCSNCYNDMDEEDKN